MFVSTWLRPKAFEIPESLTTFLPLGRQARKRQGVAHALIGENKGAAGLQQNRLEDGRHMFLHRAPESSLAEETALHREPAGQPHVARLVQ